METSGPPLYRSGPTLRSLGNEYTIYGDRIELKCRFPFLNKTIVISREDIVAIALFEPPVIRTSFTALKLDLADLFGHVGITRKRGIFHQLRFTPSNPQEFVAMARRLLALPE